MAHVVVVWFPRCVLFMRSRFQNFMKQWENMEPDDAGELFEDEWAALEEPMCNKHGQPVVPVDDNPRVRSVVGQAHSVEVEKRVVAHDV